MHDSRKTVPTFLVYGAGAVFLTGTLWAWVVQPVSDFISRTLGFSSPTHAAALTSCLATLVAQRLLIAFWQWWIAPKAPSADSTPIQLSPDKRQRIQTGQAP